MTMRRGKYFGSGLTGFSNRSMLGPIHNSRREVIVDTMTPPDKGGPLL